MVFQGLLGLAGFSDATAHSPTAAAEVLPGLVDL